MTTAEKCDILKAQKRKGNKKMNDMSDRYDYGYKSNEPEAKGLGTYKQVAYNPEIKVLCKIDDLVLRTVKTSIATKFEILTDGVLLNRYPNQKTAEMFFCDFAGITKAKYKKLATA